MHTSSSSWKVIHEIVICCFSYTTCKATSLFYFGLIHRDDFIRNLKKWEKSAVAEIIFQNSKILGFSLGNLWSSETFRSHLKALRTSFQSYTLVDHEDDQMVVVKRRYFVPSHFFHYSVSPLSLSSFNHFSLKYVSTFLKFVPRFFSLFHSFLFSMLEYFFFRFN